MAVRLALKGRGRAGIGQRLGLLGDGFEAEAGGKAVWVHAVSVGETLAAVPIVKALGERRPGLRIYFSTVTETGNKVARENLEGLAKVFYFPFDFPSIVRRVVRRLRPDVFVVVETEIWPNLLKALRDKGIPAVMVNGRISPRSFKGYSRAKFFMRAVLPLFSGLNMQSSQDAERITALGADPKKVKVAGNVKFDQACRALDGGRAAFTRAALGLPDRAVVMIAGSTHEGEEKEALLAYGLLREEFEDSFLVIAPRHPERFSQVEDLIRSGGMPCVRKSASAGERLTAPCVMLLDTMGELASFYRVCDVVFVGGSWTAVGGHNVLEPAAFGKAVFFGPHMHNFEEISRILKSCGVGIEVKDGRELAAEAVRLLREPARVEAVGKAAKEALMRNRGALDRNVELVERFLG
ncbi:MAG TPA: 3-deoxy-D-manno-octulosonic acid transferase [Nitrospirota bacterium]|nr:3-deoxy-D-manno-octulosonic acid transferase [Nitrospirota bacterium]